MIVIPFFGSGRKRNRVAMSRPIRFLLRPTGLPDALSGSGLRSMHNQRHLNSMLQWATGGGDGDGKGAGDSLTGKEENRLIPRADYRATAKSGIGQRRQAREREDHGAIEAINGATMGCIDCTICRVNGLRGGRDREREIGVGRDHLKDRLEAVGQAATGRTYLDGKGSDRRLRGGV